jgi:hypothetical protein
MMKKRITISVLTLLFLVSTTGLPVSYHLCKMMEQKSLNDCEVCKAEMEKIKPSCCAEETMEFSVTISSDNSNCCQDELVYNKVEDEFVNNKTETKNFVILDHSIIASVSPADFTQSLFSHKYLISSSPPTFLTTNIYLNNSVFLI